jgi:hypothetical protein
MPLFFIFTFRFTIYTFIHSYHSLRPHPYLHSCRHCGRNLYEVSSRDSNSRLPYSKPVHYLLSYATPFLSYAAPLLSYAAPSLSKDAPSLSNAAPFLSYAVPCLSYTAPSLSYTAPLLSYAAPFSTLVVNIAN